MRWHQPLAAGRKTVSTGIASIVCDRKVTSALRMPGNWAVRELDHKVRLCPSLTWSELPSRLLVPSRFAMYVEEICLSAPDLDPEPQRSAEPARQVAALEQINRMRRCRSQFTLYSNQRLAVRTQGVLQDPRDYRVDLRILDPQPKRQRRIAWHYVLGFAVLSACAGFLALLSDTTNSTPLAVMASVSAALSLVLAIYRSHDRLVFYSQHGRVPLVVLFSRLPDRVTLDGFTDALIKEIKDARVHYPYSSETLSEELKEHRRLREAGVISSRRYDIVKQRILRQHSWAKRGAQRDQR